MDIGDWLRSLGLEQYEPAFRDNDIDAEVLPELTAEDLVGLGVASIGHRRKLLGAIAALGAAVPTPAASATTVTVGTPRYPAQVDAERRQLTVMFCDLVGSTALSTRHDPEDLRELIGDYHRAVADTVGRLDGFVAKYMGDGVLIYFGYPQAHEDDAERAVRAGLAVIEAVGRLPVREDLTVRLGIATGLAVVGDLIGEGAAQERGVVGETPNLAARLQGLGAPNTLVIGEATRRQIGGLFDLDELGPQSLAGFAEPQLAWRVLGESGAVSRFEALRSGETPLVGREEEVELLIRRWQQAKSGDGRVVLISGEPGIGKSRLTAALSAQIGTEPHVRLRYFCLPHHQDSAFHPFIAQLERAAGFDRDDTVDARFGKLRMLLAPGSRDGGDIALLSELLSLPNTAADLSLSPQRKREKLFEALLNQLEAEARRQPVLMVFEDAHWIDPTSRELLDLTVDQVRRLPVLLAITFRPEFQPPWSGGAHVTSLALNRLCERAGEALVQTLAGNTGLAAEIVAEIVERADGVPLFVEELTKAVLESGAENGREIAASVPGVGLGVPATLQASLLARLDRLGPAAKEVAQIAAAIGHEFSYELAALVGELSEERLQEALQRLVEAGLVFQRGVPPSASYLFKHALVQDTAYGTLLRGPRRRLHARIADALSMPVGAVDPFEVSELFDKPAAMPEIIAHHLESAGRPEEAIEHWREAGERAVRRAANREAIVHFGRAVEILNGLPQSLQRDERELVLQVALVTPLWASYGFGSPEAERASRRAFELCQRAGADTPAHFRALYGLSYVYLLRGDLRTARPLAEQLPHLAERLHDPELLAYAHFEMGCEQLWSAELAGSRAHLEHGIALYDPQWGRFAASRHAFNCASNCHSFLTRVCWHLGYPDQAMRHSMQAISIAEEVSHPFSQGVAFAWTTGLHQLRGEAGRTRESAEALLAFATEQVFPFLMAHAVVLRGWALVAQGHDEEGVAQLREGLAAYRATGALLESSHWLGLLAESCRDTGRIEEGLGVVAEALDHVAQTGIAYYEAELHRLEGELRLRCNPADTPAVEACFRRAIEIAERQQAKSWELRAATSLARLWGEQGRRAEARDLLAPVSGWFTEGFDTADLKEAKALLDELT